MAYFYDGMYCPRCGESEVVSEGIEHWYCQHCDTHYDEVLDYEELADLNS